MDQMIFVQQHGKNRHEHICECLELFAAEIQPAFKARELEREVRKQAELAPYIEAALARKPRMAMPADADIPVIKAAGKRLEEAGTDYNKAGAPIPIPRAVAVFPYPGRTLGSPQAATERQHRSAAPDRGATLAVPVHLRGGTAATAPAAPGRSPMRAR